jgi:hypothetical protein
MTKRNEIVQTTTNFDLKVPVPGTGIYILKLNKSVFLRPGSTLDPNSMTLWIRIRIRIRFEIKCWIRIRIKVNPDTQPL